MGAMGAPATRQGDKTEAHLSGASRYEPAAFQSAVPEDVLDAHVSIRTATRVISDEGNRREVVAERCRRRGWTPTFLSCPATERHTGSGAPIPPSLTFIVRQCGRSTR
jgi:hypothetical protein